MRNILIVEDEALIAMAYEDEVLSIPDCKAYIAASFEDAVKELAKRPIDLVIMDNSFPGQKMPTAGGELLLNYIGRNYADLRVISVSATSDLEANLKRKQVLKMPFRFFAKPVIFSAQITPLIENEIPIKPRPKDQTEVNAAPSP